MTTTWFLQNRKMKKTKNLNTNSRSQICDLLTTIDIVLSVGVEYDVKYSLGRQVSSLKPAPPSYGQHVYMKRSSSAAKLPQAMSNKLICLHIEFLFMAKCFTWHVDNVFINAFRLKFRLSNSTLPKTACSSKIPKTKKKFENFFAPAQTKVSLVSTTLNFGVPPLVERDAIVPLLSGHLYSAYSAHFCQFSLKI